MLTNLKPAFKRAVCRGNLLASSRECYFELTGSVMDIKITCAHVGETEAGRGHMGSHWDMLSVGCGGDTEGDTRCILSSPRGRIRDGAQ